MRASDACLQFDDIYRQIDSIDASHAAAWASIPPASDSVDSAADLLSKVLNLENLCILNLVVVLNLVYVLVLQIQIPVATRVLPRSCHPKFSIFII